MRGQAFVIMNDVNAATAAMQAENGLNLFGKDLVIEYAREKSNRIAKRDGTFQQQARKTKRVKREEQTIEGAVEQENEQTEKENPGTAPIEVGTPSSLLLAKDLPEECNNMMMEMLFRQYKGFVKSEMPRTGIAILTFENEPSATAALQAMQHFDLTATEKLKLIYGKE